jgi:hypothetical protein
MAHLKLLSAFLAFTGNKVEGLLQARNPCYGGFALPRTPDDGAVNGCPPKLLPAAKKSLVSVPRTTHSAAYSNLALTAA